MKRRTLISGLGTAALGGIAATGAASAASDGYEIELFSGDTFSYAATSRAETTIYAPLQDGSTYYLFQVQNGCFGVDEVVMILGETAGRVGR